MTTYPNDLSRFGGNNEPFAEHEWTTSVARLLPEDFPARLERLKEASGLTWSGMARAIGVEYKLLLTWRNGAVPSGGAYHALVRFAGRVQGGLDILMGEGFLGYQLALFEDEEDEENES